MKGHILSLLLASQFAVAGPVEKFFLYQQQQESQTAVALKTIKTGYYDQLIDPEQPTAGTFKQKYYIDESLAKDANSPVFFYICGEAACHEGALHGAIRNYAKRYNARLVALEHRYYGESQPYKDLSTEHLSKLTIRNALSDLAKFQRWITSEKGWQGKWISFGGSYPGSLSAYYRMRYPYLVAGAVASSAPVRAQESFPEYDQHVTKVAGQACADAMRTVVREIESKQQNSADFAEIKRKFDAEDVKDDQDFFYLVADIGATAIQYGMHQPFCQALTKNTDKVTAYADFAREIYRRFGVSAVDMTVQAAESDVLDQQAQGVGMRQWYFQSCLEYGYWQVAHPDATHSTRSSQIDLPYHHKICQRLFQMNQPAKVEKTNADFFTPLLNEFTSHIIFLNGSNDPWSNLSITPDSEWASNPQLIYELIEGTAHCNDLHSPSFNDSNALKAARQKVMLAIREWLMD